MKIAAKALKDIMLSPIMIEARCAAWRKPALLFMLSLALAPASVFAADAPMPTPPPVTGMAAAPVTTANATDTTITTTTTANVPAVADAPKIIPPAGPIDSSAALAAAMPDVVDKNDKGSRGLAAAEEKITDSAKAAVKRLNAADNLTLDDLNAARQAVAKIDALIDIEKRLNELQKLRAERDDKSLEGALPASALSMPMPVHGGGGASMPSTTVSTMAMNTGTMSSGGAGGMASMSGSPMPVSMLQPGGSLEVSRIIGSNGSFTAVVKTGDGQTRTVERGDKLPEGTVEAITSAGVLLEHNGSKHLIHVKNIETVFGYAP